MGSFEKQNDEIAVLLMVSGGSDSEAMLELFCLLAAGAPAKGPQGEALLAMVREALPHAAALSLRVLHINHLLRGEQSDADEAFVVGQCENFGVSYEVRRIDVGTLCASSSAGMEATARAARYAAANDALDAFAAEARLSPERALICTAHTLDDRVETYLMRTLVGCGPGGLASIPRRNGRILRPLLSATRQQLREFLREQHPGVADEQLWRDDPTNDDGSNFRSQVRNKLVPVMNELRPGFERSLERTMDLIADEDAALSASAACTVYTNLSLEGECTLLPCSALTALSRPQARRVLRQCLLAVNADARLQAAQIERVLELVAAGGTFSTEVDGGIRVQSDGCNITMLIAQ